MIGESSSAEQYENSAEQKVVEVAVNLLWLTTDSTSTSGSGSG